MQAWSRKNYNMVSSVVKSAQNNYSVNSTTMPMKLDSPPASVNQVVQVTKVPNGAISSPNSPKRVRVTRSRIRCQKEEESKTATTKTLGASSNDANSLTSQERVVCPELAINYANTVISTRLGALNSKQVDLESKLVKLSKKLRHKQLQLANSHARKQLDFYNQDRSTKRSDSILSNTDVSEMEVDFAKAIPNQVNGASDDKVSKPEQAISPIQAEHSFSSSLESSFRENTVDFSQIEKRLEFSRQMVDEDVTDCSSDEEAETEVLSDKK